MSLDAEYAWPFVFMYFICQVLIPDLIDPVLHILPFIVSLQGKMGEPGETGPKGFPVSSLFPYMEKKY